MARRFGQMLEADLAILNKVRPEHDTAEVTEVIGHVEGKVAIMSDDMIMTGGTLIAGARRCAKPARPRSTPARRTGSSRATRSRRSRRASSR